MPASAMADATTRATRRAKRSTTLLATATPCPEPPRGARAADSARPPLDAAPGDRNILLGKVLRITRDGGIPPNNPYTGSDSQRCNVAGRTDPGKNCQETFASGLRNPFRPARHPDAPGARP